MKQRKDPKKKRETEGKKRKREKKRGGRDGERIINIEEGKIPDS